MSIMPRPSNAAQNGTPSSALIYLHNTHYSPKTKKSVEEIKTSKDKTGLTEAKQGPPVEIIKRESVKITKRASVKIQSSATLTDRHSLS